MSPLQYTISLQSSSDGGLADFEILGGGNDGYGGDNGSQQYGGYNEGLNENDIPVRIDNIFYPPPLFHILYSFSSTFFLL